MIGFVGPMPIRPCCRNPSSATNGIAQRSCEACCLEAPSFEAQRLPRNYRPAERSRGRVSREDRSTSPPGASRDFVRLTQSEAARRAPTRRSMGR